MLQHNSRGITSMWSFSIYAIIKQCNRPNYVYLWMIIAFVSILLEYFNMSIVLLKHIINLVCTIY